MAEDDTTQTDQTATPAESDAPTLSAREERARAAQAAKSSRPSRTPEQRDAERRELRRAKAVARTRRREQEKAKRKASATAGTLSGTPVAEPKVATPQVRDGTVASARADKTITVRIDVVRRHRRYGKVVRSTTKLHAHDETNDAREGDRVRVIESRPLSRTKRWKLVEVLERAK